VIFMSISWDLVEFYWDTMENDRENWNHAWFCWENLQETMLFPMKMVVSCKFSLKPNPITMIYIDLQDESKLDN